MFFLLDIVVYIGFHVKFSGCIAHKFEFFVVEVIIFVAAARLQVALAREWYQPYFENTFANQEAGKLGIKL